MDVAERRARLVALFESWLERALAEEGPLAGIEAGILAELEGQETAVRRVDLYTLFAGLTALTQEVKLQGRSFKGLTDTVTPLVERLDEVAAGQAEALEAARALFWINIAMLGTFWLWGAVNPWLARKGHHADELIKRGLPLSFVLMAILVIAGDSMPEMAGVGLAAYCVSSTFVALSQPAVAMAFPSTLAGRALTAYNLIMFAGVFAVQWGIGLAVDAFRAAGLDEILAFQSSMGLFLLCCVVSYGYFLVPSRDNPLSVTP